MVTDLGQARDRHQLQQIIAGLSEGVILIEPGQRIVWGNEAALAMHGVESLEDLGATVDAYRRRFRLRYRNNHILKKSDYPLARVIAGETFSDVTVEVCAAGRDERWVHSIRSQVVTDADGQPDCLVLIITDVTEQYEAEARFESAFNANPAPAAIARLSDRRQRLSYFKPPPVPKTLTTDTLRVAHRQAGLHRRGGADGCELAMDDVRNHANE